MKQGDALIVANAVIWAAVIAAVALLTDGTGVPSQLLLIVGGGAAASVVIVGGGIRRLQRTAEE